MAEVKRALDKRKTSPTAREPVDFYHSYTSHYFCMNLGASQATAWHLCTAYMRSDGVFGVWHCSKGTLGAHLC